MARLLLRRDTQETVLFVDRAYFEGEKDRQAQDMLRQQVRSWVAARRSPRAPPTALSASCNASASRKAKVGDSEPKI